MTRQSRFLAVIAAATVLSWSAQSPAYDQVIDETPSGEAMTFDLLVVRPLSLVGTLVGVAVYIVALPINAITLNFEDPARRLILEPAKYTFARDLGDLD